MRQRRGVNFMGNSYMDWKEKGKGFFKGTGAREQVEGAKWKDRLQVQCIYFRPYTCPFAPNPCFYL